MHRKSSAISNTGRLGLGKTATLGLVTALAFFVLSGAVALYITHHLRSSNDRVIQTHQVIVAVDQLLLDIQNAETGQRGFLLTGDEKYLEPYNTALSRVQSRMSRVGGLIADDSAQLERFKELQGLVAAKFRIMEETIATYRSQGQAAAVAEVNSDVGIEAMDSIRALIAQLRDAEIDVRTQRITDMGNAFGFAVVVSVLTGLLGVALTLMIGVMMRRAALASRRYQWLQAAQLGLGAQVAGDLSTAQVGQQRGGPSFSTSFLPQ